jgi:cytochrome c oxidase cbb3-type subunit I/II
MEDPASTTPGSIMPKYPWLLSDTLDFAGIQKKVDAMAMLGVPYGDAINHAEAMARAQATKLGESIRRQGGPDGLGDKKIIALIAYLQRLGTDIHAVPKEESEGVPVAAASRDSGAVVARAGGN